MASPVSDLYLLESKGTLCSQMNLLFQEWRKDFNACKKWFSKWTYRYLFEEPTSEWLFRPSMKTLYPILMQKQTEWNLFSNGESIVGVFVEKTTNSIDSSVLIQWLKIMELVQPVSKVVIFTTNLAFAQEKFPSSKFQFVGVDRNPLVHLFLMAQFCRNIVFPTHSCDDPLVQWFRYVSASFPHAKRPQTVSVFSPSSSNASHSFNLCSSVPVQICKVERIESNVFRFFVA
jgi:hypothetical protein